MKQENNIEQLFNTEPLLNDLNKVIQNGLNNLLRNYINNYKLYEETHNCIMNLPSVKREIAKKNEHDEIYADLPDLISISSDGEEYNNYYTKQDCQETERMLCGNLYKPIDNDFSDNDEKPDEIMLKMFNDLLKEKEEKYENSILEYHNEINDLKDKINVLLEENNQKNTLFHKQKELYENMITEYNKVIDDLKSLNNISIKQSLVYDLTHQDDDEDIINEPSQEVVVEIKQEKENIILHIEENSDVNEEVDDEEEEEADEEEEESNDEEEEEADDEDEEAAEDELAIEDEEVDEDNEEVVEEDVEEDEEPDEEAELSENNEEVDEEAELSEDEVETEKSASEDEDEGEEEELFEIEIDGVTYCTENEENGFIYVLDEDGNVGEATGYLKNGEPFFN
jgi:hypothetical protein